MEVIQGKSTNKKIVIAQEIAFAKVLAGNNKTLRDRAVRKLKKWLTLRGNGKWQFTEDEFLRIWTGLFYCMWMSDKFLVQEELAETISSLIHCFKGNPNSALLFIKCFNKRILMDWDGLDQYRIDKFNMLIRRFLRQTFVYCQEKNWEKSLLNKLTDIFYQEVLHRNNSLGFVLHFVSIYAEELAKIGKEELNSETVLKLVEPFVKLLARTTEARIRKETEDFFIYLMKQTDQGIEFEEKFNAWKEQGFPGKGLDDMGGVEVANRKGEVENGCDDVNEEEREEEEDLYGNDQVLDPRAGSVHVFLPQIPIDIDGFIKLFKKHESGKQTQNKGRKLLKSLIQKYQTLKKGRFPIRVEKPSILMTKLKKKQSVKRAKELLEFTADLENGPIKTKEFKKLSEELEKDSDDEGEDKLYENEAEDELDEDNEGDDELDEESEGESGQQAQENKEVQQEEEEEKLQIHCKSQNKFKEKNHKKKLTSLTKENSSSNAEKILHAESKVLTKHLKKNSFKKKKQKKTLEKRKKKMKSGKSKQEGKSTQQILANQCIVVTPKKKLKKELSNEKSDSIKKDDQKTTPVQKTGTKRKFLSNWQVQELDSSSPEYSKIETQKIITIEKKVKESDFLEEFNSENASPEKKNEEENKTGGEEKKEEIETFSPVFWEKAKAKANRLSGKKSKVFVNPFARKFEPSTTPSRRISFALDRNMAQENEEYLEEVKNSPRVPFDGTKKPAQSALKSGLAPSPVNPFYQFKKIKLNM